MDRYEKEEDYYLAKFNIKNNATEKDFFVLNLDSKESFELYKISRRSFPIKRHT